MARPALQITNGCPAAASSTSRTSGLPDRPNTPAGKCPDQSSHLDGVLESKTHYPDLCVVCLKPIKPRLSCINQRNTVASGSTPISSLLVHSEHAFVWLSGHHIVAGFDILINLRIAMGNTPVPPPEIPRPLDATLHQPHPQSSATDAPFRVTAGLGISVVGWIGIQANDVADLLD